MNSHLHHAPRFHAYFERVEGRSVLLMSRRGWQELSLHKNNQTLEIDIFRTPMAGLAKKGLPLITVAERRSNYEIFVEVYRHDPKDALPINMDRYLVWETLPPHRDYLEMVNSASTEDNSNMRSFLKDHIFMVKELPGPDHWQSELPERLNRIIKEQALGWD
jgi:hypothetical protein